MGLEVRFTPIGKENEITFSIIDLGVLGLFLYSNFEGEEIKIQLINDNGLLTIDTTINPFVEEPYIISERLAGLSSEWIEARSSGIEPTSEVVQSETSNRPGYGPDDIFVENKPFSLRQILELINDGDIELSPGFQRNFVWDKTRQSKLIESILLGLPLPSIYLSQYEDGRLTVVDGLQRLTTIKLFLENQLTLSNLEYLKDCNGKKYNQLDSVLSPLRIRRFGQTQIMCFVIDYRSPSKLKFDLFRRLNTGGKPLNNQEIRNCLSKPDIQGLLKEMSELESFQIATGNSIKDTRMDAREAALRFIYFNEKYREHNPVGEYTGDMESTLDDFTDKLNTYDIEDLIGYIELYDRGMKNAYHAFGSYTFRKVLEVGGRKTQINKLMMLTFSLLFSKYENQKVIDSIGFGELMEPLINLIIDDEDLFSAITYGTNGKANIDKAFRSFNQFLKEYINE